MFERVKKFDDYTCLIVDGNGHIKEFVKMKDGHIVDSSCYFKLNFFDLFLPAYTRHIFLILHSPQYSCLTMIRTKKSNIRAVELYSIQQEIDTYQIYLKTLFTFQPNNSIRYTRPNTCLNIANRETKIINLKAGANYSLGTDSNYYRQKYASQYCERRNIELLYQGAARAINGEVSKKIIEFRVPGENISYRRHTIFLPFDNNYFTFLNSQNFKGALC